MSSFISVKVKKNSNLIQRVNDDGNFVAVYIYKGNVGNSIVLCINR